MQSRSLPLLLALLASSLPSLVSAATAPQGFVYCWSTLVPQPASDNWAVGVLLPFVFVLLAVLLNAAANLRGVAECRRCGSARHRPLWGRGLPISAERDTVLRSWLWISGVPLLPLLGLAITPWILLQYTPRDRCSIGHAARLWIDDGTVHAIAAIHLCIVPVVLIANVLVQQHYPQRRFCGRKGGGEHSGRISVRVVGAVINKLVAVLVVVSLRDFTSTPSGTATRRAEPHREQRERGAEGERTDRRESKRETGIRQRKREWAGCNARADKLFESIRAAAPSLSSALTAVCWLFAALVSL